MAIFNRKQELGGKIIKEKKDTSVFEGKPHMPKNDFMRQLKSQRFYKTTGLKEKERTELGGKLFKSYGSYVDPGEIKEVKKQLELGRYGKFKELPEKEREKAMKLVKEVLGK